MSIIEDRLAAIGENLPKPKKAVANYLGSKRSKNILYASGRKSTMCGELGTDLNVAEGKMAAKEAILDILAIVKEDLGGLESVIGVDKLNGFVRSAPTFTEQPQVIDGASDLLIAILGEEGRHARTATGAAQLPYGAAVQLEAIFRLKDE